MLHTGRVLALLAALTIPSIIAAQTYPNTKDPRSLLKPGRLDGDTVTSNMRLVSFSQKPAVFDSARGLTFINSDLAFRDKYVYQGNFAGFTIWDVSDPAKPKVVSAVSCITSQGDPSIYGNLLFLSAEGGGNRNDCAKGGVKDPRDHMAGVRIYDVSDPANPRLVKNVQTCKGSHTHTIVPHYKDRNIIYIYVSGSQAARPDSIVPGCKNGDDPADETNSLYRLDVIKVDVRHPEKAEVVTGARIFTGLDPAPLSSARQAAAAARAGDTTRRAPTRTTGPRNCHDVTAYPSAKLLAGACGSYGLLVDISNPEKPKRLAAKADTNFSLWHTAVFSNDGKKVVFTDEWGGGTSPMCQANSMLEMGGNTILTIDKNKQYKQHAYFKIPSAQTAEENCVSHNGGLIPVPGRDIMVQGWYQGGVSVMDFSNADDPKELAYFDRGAIDPPPGVDVPVTASPGGRGRATIGGSWGAYYWNGYIYSSELDRGFDILELTPSEHLSKNEIEAAKLVRFAEYNPQSQPKIEWPAAFVVVRAYLDQLVRNQGLAAERTTAIASALDAAEAQTGSARRNALNALAKNVDRDVKGAKDPERVKAMSAAIKALAKATTQ
ncbi:MAG TPA: hypothetical protein VJ717_02105 [Gemmatimonadaceae bacterium]|nr:hypothetical protein [Gemmatimonadaceae bacterium]